VVSVQAGQSSSGVGCCQAAAYAHFGDAAKVAFFLSGIINSRCWFGAQENLLSPFNFLNFNFKV
jgi:hypothetical protein